MYSIDIEGCPDAELDFVIDLLLSERKRREMERARVAKSDLARMSKRDPRCPRCGVRLQLDGSRHDGVRSYECPKCGAKSSDASGTSLSSSKLPVSKIEDIVTLIMMDCPDWVVARVAGVNIKTAQFWVDRCLDAAVAWSKEAKLSKHFWFDEMRFAPTRATGFEEGVWTTYAGKIAKDSYMEVAFDGRSGFCHVFYEKLGAPTRDMVSECFRGRVTEGAKATHDGSPSHNQMIKENRLTDDWHKFVKGDKEYESAMKLMSNCCSYLRHAFESHNGIKYTKLEAYGNWFLYRWMHRRKYGLEASVKFLISRIFGTPKSHKFDDYGRKDEIWSR